MKAVNCDNEAGFRLRMSLAYSCSGRSIIVNNPIENAIEIAEYLLWSMIFAAFMFFTIFILGIYFFHILLR